MKLFILLFSIISVTVCTHLHAGIEDEIKAALPPGSFLREFEKIPDIKGDVYIGLYVLNSKSSLKKENPVGQSDPSNLFFTCPEATVGQPIVGDYYLFSFSDKVLTSTLVVPSSYGDSLSVENMFSFYNTTWNNCNYFDFISEGCQNKATNILEKTKLIQMLDLTGDKKRFEFVLTGTAEGCGYISRLIAGYDEKLNSVVIYPVNSSGKIYYWNYRFIPIDGTCSVVELCGDYGNETYERRDYGFNALTKQYDLIYEEIKECQ